jgi:hypothetical protein
MDYEAKIEAIRSAMFLGYGSPECSCNVCKAKNQALAILREAFPDPSESGQGEADKLEAALRQAEYYANCGTDYGDTKHVRILAKSYLSLLAARQPESAEPHLPWKDSLEIALAENAELKIRAEKAESEARALRDAGECLLGAISHGGEWDDGCFYFNDKSASELQPSMRKMSAALSAPEGKSTE